VKARRAVDLPVPTLRQAQGRPSPVMRAGRRSWRAKARRPYWLGGAEERREGNLAAQKGVVGVVDGVGFQKRRGGRA
jgi:hypothetical protein